MKETIPREIFFYQQAIMLERIYPRTVRRFVNAILFVLTIACLVASLLYVADASLKERAFVLDVLTTGRGDFFFGLFLMSFSLLYFSLMLTFYYNARFYRGIESITHEGDVTDIRGVSYEVAAVLATDYLNITRSLFSSRYGIEMLERCNIPLGDAQDFLRTKEHAIAVDVITLPEKGFVTLETLADYVYRFDDEFKAFLFAHAITDALWRETVLWTMRTHHHKKHDTRWWSRDNLGKVAVIGREWAYGSAFLLNKYARDIKTTAIFSVLSKDVAYADEKVEQIESALSRSKDANVILVGEEGFGAMDIVMRLSQKIANGDASPAIIHKRVIVFDADSFVAQHEGKEALEEGIVRLFTEVIAAGNIIMVIDDLPAFLKNAASTGVNIASLIDEYLASPLVQVIATSDPVQYHNTIETKPTLAHRFERIQIASPDLSSSIRVLEGVATAYERKYPILFTYPAIEAIVDAADRNIVDGVMPDKAVKLLSELAPHAKQNSIRLITKEYVFDFVTTKTGIPTGPVRDEGEREKLLNLEKILHERVIGQDNAIVAISGVMRRARAGVQDKDRPLGSFMFLGSTGVGKTETAKALAFVFFGAEDNMSRVDMSEYSGAEALARLIGDGKDDGGTLPLLLKEKPYGVLLLDEFEKATSKVHDLFLQIVDEGYFTDARGEKINVRNNIIIATSNAGAKIIWELAKQEKNPNDSKDAIIESIIREGVYKPELLNRFDGLIIFEPLKLDEQERIAKIMLMDLQGRIRKKGYELVIDDVLVSLLVKEGYDPEFGARPMRRVLQDVVEEKIAEKIIKGGLKTGDKIWFYEEDFVKDKAKT